MAIAKPPKTFDVWFVAVNTVYRAVPYQVVADWTQQGRLSPADKLRPAGVEVPWKAVNEWSYFADYIPRPAVSVVAAAATGEVGADMPVVAIPEAPEEESLINSRRPGEEDDEVDMIPLIDISMVLLVFFIMASAAGALSPVDVPDMRYAGDLVADPEAITISIQKKPNGEEVYYTVREGTNPPKSGLDDLANDRDTMEALDRLLAERTRPPEVRIACEKDLPSDRVHELAKELKRRFDQRKINSYVATVNEAAKQ
jgi:biopolymer transport protein ExbD